MLLVWLVMAQWDPDLGAGQPPMHEQVVLLDAWLLLALMAEVAVVMLAIHLLIKAGRKDLR